MPIIPETTLDIIEIIATENKKKDLEIHIKNYLNQINELKIII